MPGDSLQVINNETFINGQKMKDPEKMQLVYFVETTGMLISEKQFRELGVSLDDQYLYNKDLSARAAFEMLGIQPNANGNYNPVYMVPLTKEALGKIQKSGIAKSIIVQPEIFGGPYVYPGKSLQAGWTRDNYGPVWIPKKGATIRLTPDNLALYSRCIKNYELNDLKVENGRILINGSPADSYTFKYDYYFMMGDNRHKSADSRFWGFVPEDHVVGKPLLVWLSTDKDRNLFNGGIRWKRLFKMVGNE